ncbi:MAG TPA: AarF/ABC1/UbiB kinase family protein [Anaerohalosphaeraceae bacterium]|nr:AarF/ABC1/UbiB kinase family protein [Anaerohalosphaeraceae bacterium]HPB93220.1 AarF/ABC1/UbiB kinase family protein [Anaerohalosphaeraceae bacterium]HRT23512.1 AarF/ABC1/UbiB kinase family protein [Anaerohalosphaeraceae bacterium]
MQGLFYRVRRTAAHLARYRHIMSVLIKYGFEEVAGLVARRFRVGLGSKGIPTNRSEEMLQVSAARRLRMAMEELGPTFIKLGQLLSTRPDLIPAEFVEEFERLQDQVTPERPEIIREEIRRQLGAYPEELFAAFEVEPIAAASIAQVHRVRLKDGRIGAMKIRRPGIVKVIRTELEILEDFAALLKRRLRNGDVIDPQRMVREFAQAVLKEVDLSRERKNLQRFGRNFADDPTVHVPAVFEEYCTEAILMMEFIEGIKPSQVEQLRAEGYDPKEIARRGADFVLKQVFDFGFFHTDPHPGNFLIMKGNVLAPLDFGQVGRLSRPDRELMQAIVLSIVSGDVTRVLQALERAEMIEERTDILELRRDLEDLLDNYSNMPLKDIPFGEAIRRGFEIIRSHHIQPPRDFTLMLKCLMTIESFARGLDPDFQIINHLKPYARRFTMESYKPSGVLRQLGKAVQGAGELAGRFPEDAAAILSKVRRGQFHIHIHHEHLDELERTMDNSSNRLSFAIIIAALLIASSLLVAQEGTVLGLLSLEALGIAGYLTAAVVGVWLLVLILQGRRF